MSERLVIDDLWFLGTDAVPRGVKVLEVKSAAGGDPFAEHANAGSSARRWAGARRWNDAWHALLSRVFSRVLVCPDCRRWGYHLKSCSRGRR